MRLKYNPDRAPDPKTWLSLDEGDRIELVRAYHRRARIRVPNMMLHTAVHATVETQIALGDELPVKGKLETLVKDGLDRHEAVHAIGSVLAEHMYNISKERLLGKDPNERYFEVLESLTAESWRTAYADRDNA